MKELIWLDIKYRCIPNKGMSQFMSQLGATRIKMSNNVNAKRDVLNSRGSSTLIFINQLKLSLYLRWPFK